MIGLFSTFMIYRGPKWRRGNFLLFSLFNATLVVICIDPDIANFLPELLSLGSIRFGRMLALLIVSNLFLLYYVFSTRSKIESIRLQLDKLIRNFGTTDFEECTIPEARLKPIMIIVPAFNEGDNLSEFLPKIPRQISGKEVGVLMVDDGSEDETARIGRDHGCLVAVNRINRGQGAASRLGYDILIKYDIDIGVTMDADNQHRPEDIEKLVLPIIGGTYDLVIGSRILGKHDGSSLMRTIGIRLFSRMISFSTGQRITDCSSGFKAFNVAKMSCLNLKEDQFQSAEVLIEAAKKGLIIGEVPITIRQRKHGVSKKGTDWAYGFSFVRTIFKTWWR